MKRIMLFAAAMLLLFSACVSNSEDAAKASWSSNDGFPAWKGEKKSLCAELEPNVDLRGVTVKLSDLKSGDSRIMASAVKAQFVSYVMADVIDTTQFEQCGWRPAGQYDSLYVPEILDVVASKDLPADALSAAKALINPSL